MIHIKLSMSKHAYVKSGFTLIELAIVITIIAILLMIAIPAMRNILIENRLSGNVNEFIAAHNLARSEAIKRGRLVTVCRSINAESGSNACHKTASGDRDGDDWGVGWLVFVENSTATGIGTVNAGEEILLRQGALPDKTYSPASAKSITYNTAGEPLGSMAGSNFRFNVDGKFDRTICIARTGRIRVIRDAVACV
ncbi:GspH/FimT family pseudopilin [Undibacterium sp. Jales W-56]|uniref:GspH/FimT family pseudopilin n=1 Tax=Undibacterium sp. Jales W-56 TaxID=2897325 RepID=UPI0021CE51A9|nr:GspH/FimT family pseudopilin [Undibacterium sp. Jales W-56]MCU6435655.1 GspH/FimT family pseudopilin [Undibacterium sp. Jales W-56]